MIRQESTAVLSGNQKLAGSQKTKQKRSKTILKKHKKHCRYNLKRLPARMDMAHAALAKIS